MKVLLSSDMKLLTGNPFPIQNSKLDYKCYLTGLFSFHWPISL